MPWFAVRSVYHVGVKSDGKNIFEERVACFEAASFESALQKADDESRRYAAPQMFQVVGSRVAYMQDDEPLIEGYEVWSELYETRESPEEFFANRYERYEYLAEP